MYGSTGMAGMSGRFQVAPSGEVFLYLDARGMSGMSGIGGDYWRRDFYGAIRMSGMVGMHGIPSRFSIPQYGRYVGNRKSAAQVDSLEARIFTPLLQRG